MEEQDTKNLVALVIAIIGAIFGLKRRQKNGKKGHQHRLKNNQQCGITRQN